ncbi:beta strand repeat-containing protein [Marinicella sp. W31]|uniref:beta strand repeat-containing protein n=1 Tax=Marinicella sp. W31 TaxID=3023713 RepID=UPI003757AB69
MMKTLFVYVLTFVSLNLALSTAHADPLGTEFTYQGELKLIQGFNGIVVPANAQYDLTFTLFDALNNGAQVGSTIQLNDVDVQQGIFTVELDFGISPFSGDQLWLDIAIRDAAATGAFAGLAPRQKLTATPYALHAEFIAAGRVGSDEVDSAEVQLRIVGVCSAGTFMTAVNEDGTVVCADDSDDQTLSLTGSNLSISSGNSVDLSTVSGDNEETNELNTAVALTGTTLNVTDAGGTLSADLAVIDTDDQTLTLTGSNLSISDGNSVDLGTLSGDNDATNELNQNVSLTGTTLTVTDAGGDLSVDLATVSGDNDATNELNQNLSLAGTTLTVTDAGGDLSVDLVTVSGDNDATNELNQNVSLTGTTLTVTDAGGDLSADLASIDTDDQTLAFAANQLSIADGNSVDLSSLVNNDTNEIQDIGLSGDTLQITLSSSTVDLSTYLDNTDAQTLGLSGNTLSISGGNSVDLSVLFADNDATNELNTGFALSAGMLTITDAGGDLTADLSALSDTAAEVLAKLITVDGSGSGLDADLLDGLEASDIIAMAGSDMRTQISSIPFTISQPGSYVVTQNLTNSVNNADGIIIDANNVTLDLGGYTISGGSINSDDGIVVLGDQDNIYIYNGHVDGWNGDGINALNADNSIFEKLTVSNNDGDGLVADFNASISYVTALANGLDGIEGDDGTVIVFSTASENGDNGIQTSEGSVVAHSTAFDNLSDGIDVGAGSSVFNSAVSDNEIFGVDLALGGTVQGSSAYDNLRNGFDIASASVVRGNIASLNGGDPDTNTPESNRNGFRTFANSWLIENKAHENDGSGIRIQSTDCLVEGNNVTDNDITGIFVSSSGSFIVNNTASGNVVNYDIITTSTFGPIVDVTNVGDITSVTNADHPYANFVF